MRIMAIDLGDARTGLAVSDAMGILCGEAWTMEEWDMERAAKRIAEAAKERGVERLVLGLPKTWTAARACAPKKAADSRKCLKQSARCRSSSGTSGAAASKRTPSSTPAEKKKKNTAKPWTPWRPA